MKLKTLVLLGLFCILSCNESRLENKRVNHSNPITISPNKEVFEKSIAIADKPLKCTCVENSYKRIRDHEVSFQNIKSQAKENLDKFSKWSDDSLRFKVKYKRIFQLVFCLYFFFVWSLHLRLEGLGWFVN